MLKINPEIGFAEGGGTGDRFQKEFRTPMTGGATDDVGYSALHGIAKRASLALTAASENPATMTINDFVTFLETEANVLKVIAEW